MDDTGFNFTPLLRGTFGPHLAASALPVKKATDLAERIARLEDEQALRDLHSEYTYAYDSGDVERAVAMFHKDCYLVNPRGTYIGIDAIRENYAYLISRRRYTFHNTSNVVVRLSDRGDEAAMTSYLFNINVGKTGGITGSSGSYADKLAKIDGVWKIMERRIVINCRMNMIALPSFDTTPPPPTPSKEESSRDLVGREGLV